MTWAEISEYVLQLQHQEDVWVPKDSVVPPEVVDIPYTCGAYRKTLPDGGAIDIKEDGNNWRVHWDKYNPATHLIEHGLYDAPGEWILSTTGIGVAIGAATSPEGERGKGALRGGSIGFGLSLLMLLLGAMSSKN